MLITLLLLSRGKLRGHLEVIFICFLVDVVTMFFMILLSGALD